MGNSPSVSAEDEYVVPAHLWENALLAVASNDSIDPSQPVMDAHSLNNSRRIRMPPGGPRESDPQSMTAPLTYRSPSGLAAFFIPNGPIIPTHPIIKNESPDPEEQQRNSWLIQLRSKELAINDSSALVDRREADVRKREIQLEEDARQLRVKHEALKGREHNLGLMDAVAKHFEDKFTAQQAKIDEKVSRKHAQEIANLEQKLAAGEADYEQIVDESKNAIDWLKANFKRRDDEINTCKLFEADAYEKVAQMETMNVELQIVNQRKDNEIEQLQRLDTAGTGRPRQRSARTARRERNRERNRERERQQGSANAISRNN